MKPKEITDDEEKLLDLLPIEVQNYYTIEGKERKIMFAEAGPDTFAVNMKTFQGLVQTFANEQLSPEVAPVWLATMDPMLNLGERIAKDAQLAGLTNEEMFNRKN